MRIRTATKSDARNIARVHIASWQAAYRGMVPDEVLDAMDVDRLATQWTSNIEGDTLYTLVAHVDRDLLGFASFSPTRDADDDPRTVAEIQTIYVDPSAWRQGIGRRLCDSTFAELSARGLAEVTLWAFEQNHAARRFYEHVGFHFDGATKFETVGVPMEEVRYRKVLG